MNQSLSAIVNARLQGREGLYRLAIAEGRFSEITAQSAPEEASRNQLDAGDNLVAPPFVEPHIHLDAAMTAGQPRWNQSGTLFEGIECWSERKASLTHDDVIGRAEQTLKLFADNGIQYVRTHVDVTDPKLTGLKAMLEVRERMAETVNLQIVAFPQEGLWSFPQGKELMEEAVRLGATWSVGSRILNSPGITALSRFSGWWRWPIGTIFWSTCIATRLTTPNRAFWKCSPRRR